MTLLDLTPRVDATERTATLPVVIIGAGPIGLATAANLVERTIDFIVFESGGEVAASIRVWGHTQLFSPWRHVVDPASRRLLEALGWELPYPDRAHRYRVSQGVSRTAGCRGCDRIARPYRRPGDRRDS